jgi:hypothetical protein
MISAFFYFRKELYLIIKKANQIICESIHLCNLVNEFGMNYLKIKGASLHHANRQIFPGLERSS